MVSKKLLALALGLVVFSILAAGCCCGSGVTSTGGSAYTGKSCSSNYDCNNGQDGWYCAGSDGCQKLDYTY